MGVNVSPLAKQTWTVTSVVLTIMGQGVGIGYSSCLVPALKQPDSPIKADPATIGWMVSSVGHMVIIGLVISSLLMHYYGRRTAFILASIPAIIGWPIIYFANSITALAIGRMLAGFTGGGSMVLGGLIIGEFTSPKHRGMFLLFKTASLVSGVTVVHILGFFVHWRTIAIFALALNVMSFLITCTWPESPAWLASKKQFEKCEESFIWLRGTDEKEMNELKKLIQSQKVVSKEPRKNIFEILLEILMKFTKRDFIKPVIVIFFGALLLDSCGKHAYSAYASQILGEIFGDKSHNFYYTLGLDLVITGSVLCSSVLVRLVKRRTLLLASGVIGVLILVTLSVCLFLRSNGILSKERQWIPIVLLVMYFIIVNLGCTPMAFTWCGELFPLAHKGVGSIMAGVVLNISMLTTLSVTPHLLNSLKIYGTFGVFACVMAITLLSLYFMVPETKDKTLQEIEYFFNHGCFEAEDVDSEDNVVRMIDNEK